MDQPLGRDEGVPVKPLEVTPVRVAPLKLAPERFPLVIVALEKFELVRFVFVMLGLVSVEALKSQPDKSSPAPESMT
jgi:hypothetical protein